MAIAYILDEAGQAYCLEESIPLKKYEKLRPADILLKGWYAGKDTAVDLTVVHGWQGCQQRASREKWRAFLRKKNKISTPNTTEHVGKPNGKCGPWHLVRGEAWGQRGPTYSIA